MKLILIALAIFSATALRLHSNQVEGDGTPGSALVQQEAGDGTPGSDAVLATIELTAADLAELEQSLQEDGVLASLELTASDLANLQST